MKTVRISQLTARLVKIATVGAAALVASSAYAGIANTKHNLGTEQTAALANQLTTGTDEICVFCHTPHGANTDAVVPLWNKGFTETSSFTTYKSLGTSSLDAAELSVGSVSLACLSCHDGTQAMDNMVNAPGAGGYNAAGASLAGAAWSGTAQSNGYLTGAPIPMLGTDLTNDHPIGIQYCGGWGNNTPPTSGWDSATCADSDFVVPKSKVVATGNVWWVDTDVGADDVREKTDMILYTRDFGGSLGSGPSVECASCHDPHVETKQTSSAAPQVAFLRVSQTGSGVCLACHTK